MVSPRALQGIDIHVALACRILEDHGLGHSYLGHVSALHPESDMIHVKPSGLGLGEVCASDILLMDLSGRKCSGDGPLHAEMPIHTRIYHHRPDVRAVVHTHPLEVAGFAASTATFEMVNQDSVYFADGIGLYGSPDLVITPSQGDELALALGDRRAVLLRNHGLVTVGKSVEEAVVLSVAFVDSLRVQAMATNFGRLAPMSEEETSSLARTFAATYDTRVTVAWDYLRRQVDE